MEFFFFFISAVLIILILSSKLLMMMIKAPPKIKNVLPPSPPSLPIIGHLHLLRRPLHLSLTSLAKRYGPVVSLRLGSRPALLVSSPSAAEECLTKNDTIFANHPKMLVGEYLGFNNTDMFFAPYGQHWRNLRKITSLELLSTRRLDELAGFRQDELQRLVRHLAQYCVGSNDGRGQVSLRPKIFEMVYDAMLVAVIGKRYSGEDSTTSAEEARRFREMVDETIRVTYEFNPGDFFPLLRHYDVRGLRRSMIELRHKLFEFLGNLFDEHRSSISTGEGRRRTLVDVLLSMQETDPEYYTDNTIKGLLLTLMLGGTDTMAQTIQSAMLLLLCHPKVLNKARAELDVHVEQGRLMDDSDLPKLSYLRCVVLETLRLSPPQQGLPPRASSEDCTIQGFYVPRGTMLFINVWAMQRDPELWDDPLSFKPERFTGHDSRRKEKEGFKYLPFGSGRRSCPGEGLGMRLVTLAIGALIQCFEWETAGEEEVDMSAVIGLTKPRKELFKAAFRLRDSMATAISQL